MLVGGAAVNALAFSGSNFLFSKLGKGSDEERERHDKAIEELQAAHEAWSRKRAERMDFITEDLRRQGQAVQYFKDADDAMRLYAQVTGENLDPIGPEPQLSDFYVPSDDQKTREFAFIFLGMAAAGFVAYKLL